MIGSPRTHCILTHNLRSKSRPSDHIFAGSDTHVTPGTNQCLILIIFSRRILSSCRLTVKLHSSHTEVLMLKTIFEGDCELTVATVSIDVTLQGNLSLRWLQIETF